MKTLLFLLLTLGAHQHTLANYNQILEVKVKTTTGENKKLYVGTYESSFPKDSSYSFEKMLDLLDDNFYTDSLDSVLVFFANKIEFHHPRGGAFSILVDSVVVKRDDIKDLKITKRMNNGFRWMVSSEHEVEDQEWLKGPWVKILNLNHEHLLVSYHIYFSSESECEEISNTFKDLDLSQPESKAEFKKMIAALEEEASARKIVVLNFLKASF